MKFLESFQAWVDGEHPFRLRAVRGDNKDKKPRPKKKEPDDEARLHKLTQIYMTLCVAVCILLLIFAVSAAVGMPAFGSDANPTNNEVPGRYVAMAEEETGAENAIAGMILNYRGFDTFGESCVLFLAVCCVMLLMWDTDGSEKQALEEPGHDAILSVMSKIIIPCVLCFGVCVLMNGHVSPGGGFSGGSVLGAALILFATAFGAEAVHRFFTKRVFNIVRITGLMIYACMFGVYIFQGANAIESDLSRYIVLVIDVAVGLVVMSTMYGFYSFYTKGDV